MAFVCVTGGRECTGCQECIDQDVFDTCTVCYKDIHRGESCYRIDGDLMHEDCLQAWAEQYQEYARE